MKASTSSKGTWIATWTSYNRERAHQGYRTQGRTSYQAFLDGVNQMPKEVIA